jgi:hypothetical protein
MSSPRPRNSKRRSEDPESPASAPRSFRRWPWLLALGLMAAAWGGLELARVRGRRTASDTVPAAGGAPAAPPRREIRTWRTFEGPPGPWGQLEYTRISIEPPDDFLPDASVFGVAHWVFPDLSPEQVEVKLGALGLDRAQLDQVRATWQVGSDGVIAVPPPDLVLGLAPSVRARVYAELSLERANTFHHFPSIVRPEFLEERLETAGLSPPTVSLFKGLLYERNSWTLFSDLPTLLQRIGDPQERRRAIAMSLRNSTFMVRLKLDERSDLAAIAHYWDFPGRAKDLQPLLHSLARVPGGYALDLAHLLPPMPRRRIYTYPPPSDDRPDAELDCYWTSVNFFASTPDDAFRVPERAVSELRASFHPVEEPYVYGDVLLMSSSITRQPVHAAVYLADSLLFSKNGGSSRQPWLVMKMNDALSYYHSLLRGGDRLQVTAYRPNNRP